MLDSVPASTDPRMTQAEAVAAMFADVFDEAEVGLDDDFFQLGGDSLKATEFMTALERRFGMVLSISVLLEAPTPRTLAAAIFEQSTSRMATCLITLNPDGERPAIFCVHGNAGESIAPQQLSAAMSRRAFFGFRAIGLEDGEEVLTSTEAIATSYLSVLTQAYPEGPLVIAGHCAGSIIAYEMAQQLERAGRPAAGLVMIDPEIQEQFAPYLHHSGMALEMLRSSWRKRAAELDAVLAANPNATGNVRRSVVANGIKLAIGTYAPRPYGGPTLLLTTGKRKPILLSQKSGYPTLLSNLVAVELKTGHGSMFKNGLAEVAKAIDDFIDQLPN